MPTLLSLSCSPGVLAYSFIWDIFLLPSLSLFSWLPFCRMQGCSSSAFAGSALRMRRLTSRACAVASLGESDWFVSTAG